MIICLDPGHGLPDPGALGSHSKEADINLAVAKALKEFLVQSGITIIMTRDDENRILESNYRGDLQARCDIANKANANYFLAIHCNSSANQKAQGSEAYCYSLGGDGEKFAEAVLMSIVNYEDSENRGVKTASFYVLHHTKMPAALIELLFISNPQEENTLIDPKWQQGAAEAIAKGICQFLHIPFTSSPKKHAIMGESQAAVSQMEKFLHEINPTAPYLAAKYIEIGSLEGVKGDMAFAQSIKETGYFRYGGAVSPDQNNFAGLGAVKGSTGAAFSSSEEGIRAQIQHLKAYASTEPLNTPLTDPRFQLVIRGSAPYWENLNGKWAVPGTHYGEEVVAIWNKILETPDDISPLPPWNPPSQQPGDNSLTQEEINTLIGLLTKLLKILKKE